MNTSLLGNVTTARPRRSVGRIMTQVMLALLPGTLLTAWLINERVLLILMVAISGALVSEALMLRLRGRQLRESLSDGSIILAAWLLALCVPPSLPLWQLLIGVFVLTTLGKHLYGGLGHNPFNPAMVAYAVLIVSFPVTMTDWQASNWQASIPVTTHEESVPPWDALSGATPLDQLRQIRLDMQHTEADSEARLQASNYSEKAQSLIMDSHWAWVNLAWLAGGVYLLLMRIITWHIPLAVLVSITAMYTGLVLSGVSNTLPPLAALLSGAIMLGAFYIATDPVTAATSRPGKLVYGLGIGILCVVIREFSSYPEGFGFAVLLMNTCVPLIDYLLTGPAGRSRRDAS